MIANCQHCGAPLDVRAASGSVRCNYCDRVNQVQRMQTIHEQTPMGWQPPPAWTPPPQFYSPQPLLQYHRPTNKAPVIVAVVAGLVLTMVTGGVAMLLTLGGRATTITVRGEESPVTTPFVYPGNAPTGGGISVVSDDRLICTGGKKSVSNQQLQSVIATNDCEVTLTGCTLKGNPGILASQSAKVIMIGGSIDPSGGVAIVANGSAVVELRNGAKLSGQVIQQGGGRVIQ